MTDEMVQVGIILYSMLGLVVILSIMYYGLRAIALFADWMYEREVRKEMRRREQEEKSTHYK